ncbi:hypothetical protein B0H13DRAFT_2398527, partial [Mycena leptocephala]
LEKFGNPEALEEGLKLLQNALILRPSPYPDRGSSLMRVATTLQARFKETSNSQDLTETIQLHWEALKLPVSDPERNNLANTLRLRFQQ